MATKYEKLLKMATKAAEEHPRSYIVMDANTHTLLGSGVNPEKVYKKVGEKLRPDQVPVVFKKLKDGEILIL
jgi:hypothetical protein